MDELKQVGKIQWQPAPEPVENEANNSGAIYGRCLICGDEHFILEPGQCSKG
jgi:hypothetical protein